MLAFVAALFAGDVLQTCRAAQNSASQDVTQAPESNFSKNPKLPAWTRPLADIPATKRTDPEVVRLAEIQYQLGPETSHLVNYAIQINERNALAKIGQYSVVYSPAFEKLVLHKVALIRAGQVIDRTATVSIRHLQRETGIEMGSYGGVSTAQFLLDDVRIGDTLWVTYSVIGENPVFDNKWHSTFWMDNYVPVELRRVSIRYPASRKLVWTQTGDFKTTPVMASTEDSKGMRTLSFEQHELDAVEYEPQTPTDFMPWRLVEFSEYKDWNGVAKWADGLFPRAKPSPQLNALVRQFDSESAPEQKAAAALHWVQNEVRYFSVSIGENSHRPQPPEAVIKRRYGDCKDKSYLLVSLLTQLGIKSRPVLIDANAIRLPSRSIPSPEWFDHVIVQIDLNGRLYYVDPTSSGQLAPLDVLQVAMPGARGLVVDPSSTDLTVIPERSDIGPLLDHQESATVPAFDQDADMSMHDVYRGTYADWARDHFNGLSANELKREVLGYYEKQFPGVTMTEGPTLRADLESNQFHVMAKLRLIKPVVYENHRYKIPFDSQVLKGTMHVPDNLTRNFPLTFARAGYKARYRLDVDWPKTVRSADKPITKSVDNPFFRITEDFLMRGNQMRYLMDYEIKSDVAKPADLNALNAEVKKLDNYAEGNFNFADDVVYSADTLDLTSRTLEASNSLGQLLNSGATLFEKNDKQHSVEEYCDFVSSVLHISDLLDSDETYVKRMDGLRNVTEFKSDAERSCYVDWAFSLHEFASLVRVAQSVKAEPSYSLKQLTWAEFFTGDKDAAIVAIDRHMDEQLAKKKEIRLLDLAEQIALYQRIGKPVPDKVMAAALGMPDGNWPRPIFLMQADKITPDELLAITSKMSGDMRSIAESEAWFFIGQKLMSAKSTHDAFVAFVHAAGTARRSADYFVVSSNELWTFFGDDRDRKAAFAAEEKKDYNTSFSIWSSRAATGNAEAQRHVGDAYYFGYGVAEDNAKAREWYLKSAAQSDTVAQYRLGQQSMYGDGVPRDDKQANEWFAKAAQQGHAGSQYYLGQNTLGGKGIDKDIEVGLAWLNRSADQNYGPAEAYLSNYYSDATDPKDRNFHVAFIWGALGTFQANPSAMANLGYLFEHGWGVKSDMVRAHKLYLAAAEQGNAWAQHSVGNDLLEGHGVAIDYREAMRWFRKSAEQGNAASQNDIGYLYDRGFGVDRDANEARIWIQKAADNGNSVAQHNVGGWFERGTYGEKDMTKAIDWYKKSAQSGNSEAANDLGAIYSKGLGTPKNTNEAIRWYTLAATRGDLIAQNNLGTAYLNDESNPDHLQLALQWFKKAALAGNADAQNNLAIMLSEGRGCDMDRVEAYKWWTLAKSRSSPGSHIYTSASTGLAQLSTLLSSGDLQIAQKASSEWHPTEN